MVPHNHVSWVGFEPPMKDDADALPTKPPQIYSFEATYHQWNFFTEMQTSKTSIVLGEDKCSHVYT